VLAEKYQPKIQEHLLADKQIHGTEEFSLLDDEIIDSLISIDTKNLALKEKKKITKAIKAGEPADQVFEESDSRILPPQEAADHIKRLQEVQVQNSGSGRMINIGGEIALIV